MKYEQYVTRHTELTARALSLIQLLIVPYRSFTVPATGWYNLLAALFPTVEQFYRESGELAREFYDSERVDKIGETSPVWTAEYKPEWFADNMKSVRKGFTADNATEGSEVRFLAQVAKEIEQGGRRTMLHAVEDDSEAVAWARVQGGEDSCSFCTMLISRGPVYSSAEAAGEMNTWHGNCDCKIVPVFNRDSWPGRDQWKAAEDLWRQATANGERGADALNSLRRLIHKKRDGDEEISLAA